MLSVVGEVRVVERAAGIGRTTPLPIPERVDRLQRVRVIITRGSTEGSVQQTRKCCSKVLRIAHSEPEGLG